MALIKCKECGREVSNKAEKCPNCGVKIKSGGCGCLSFVLVGILSVIIFVFIIGNLGIGNNSNVIEDTRTYDTDWRMPYTSELGEIGRIMVKNNIKVCGEYHVKEVESGEYVIACTPDGEKWYYYVVYKYTGKIYKANSTMEMKLEPPY